MWNHQLEYKYFSNAPHILGSQTMLTENHLASSIMTVFISNLAQCSMFAELLFA